MREGRRGKRLGASLKAPSTQGPLQLPFIRQVIQRREKGREGGRGRRTFAPRNRSIQLLVLRHGAQGPLQKSFVRDVGQTGSTSRVQRTHARRKGGREGGRGRRTFIPAIEAYSFWYSGTALKAPSSCPSSVMSAKRAVPAG